MKAFLIDGKKKSLADIIIDHRVSGEMCYVASFGFGINQILKLMQNFKHVNLLIDNQSSLRNDKSLESLESLKNSGGLTVTESRNHAKLAIIDDSVLIFTSANLSKNHRVEAYLIADLDEIEDVENFKKLFGNPECILKSDNPSPSHEIDMSEINWEELT